MPASPLRLIKRCAEFRPRSELSSVPHGTRGIYTLLERTDRDKYEVVYVGLAGGERAGVRGRLRKHAKSKAWTHFSIFEVWDNISEAEVREIEGLCRHLYRKDVRVNRLNRQRRFKKLNKPNVRFDKLKNWSKKGD